MLYSCVKKGMSI